jgi:hypothetical protein
VSDEFKVVMTTDAIEYLAKVSEWIKTAPKSDEHDEFWVGDVAVEWGHSEKPIATFRSEDDYYLVEVTNG